MVLGGDLDGAAALADRLGDEEGALLMACLDLARAEKSSSALDESQARRFASSALSRAERAGRTGPTSALAYLVSHVRLTWFTHEANLELSVAGVTGALRRSLARWGDLPCLYLALAHAHALMGRQEEATDELGRALFHSRGDRFYARLIVENPYVVRARPALAAQARAAGEGDPKGDVALPRPQSLG